ncbi:SRPBCC family protein [Gordonia jinghuaiqii]|uniref:SRPBCC family protein n=1 Tax=Gordonia jinghuaiqii TaxID=2758710 RepID=A0A7D7LVM4_9ACTN|nr:SRPBCC family protein [Gordonia jinghuaiqii]MCR5976538.1 SRPBCC family protein [Gordonia jinghuaiqii]QMS99733.1 SRPBCC family protein [Gordonia jinghuaiqii]
MFSPARVPVLDTVVGFTTPIEVTFDYLADPTNRPQWQSSLRRIDDLRGVGERAGDVGTSWTDVTVVPGVTPRMEVTECRPHRVWQEIGRWRSVDAVLTLTFEERSDGGTDVHAEAVLTVPAAGGLVLNAARWPAARAVRADITRAAAILAEQRSSR